MTRTSADQDGAVERASALCDLGRWDDAAARLRAVLATDPNHGRALCTLAQAQLGQGAYEQALRTSQSAICQNPENEWPHRVAGLALSRLGRHDEAQVMARSAVRLAPHAPESYHALARVLAAAGVDLTEARAAADRAVELAPNRAIFHTTVGSVAIADGRPGDASAAFHRALALDPDSSAAHNELGRVILARSLAVNRRLFGRADGLARAADGFATAVRADPRAGVSRRNLDLVLYVFLLRASRGIVMVAWIAMLARRASDSGPARVLPVLLLLLPAASAARFVSRLAPPARGCLVRLLRDRVVAGVVVGDAVAAVGLVVGAAFPRATSVAIGCSVAFALLARLTLWCQTREVFLNRSTPKHYVISTQLLVLALEVLTLVICTGFAPVAGMPYPVPANGPPTAVAEVALVAVAYVVRHRVRPFRRRR